MSIDTDQKRRRTSARERAERRRRKQHRDHVRRLDAPDSETQETDTRRMQPRSHVRPASSVSVSERRAERKARKIRSQAQRATERTHRRRISLWRLFSWRTVSGLLVIGLVAVLYMFLTMDAFFVSSVAIGGEKYLTREEIFRFSDIAQQHIFWIDAADVEARLESVPNIAKAEVILGWPPNMVQIVVVEREPALIWEQSVRVWVDVNGIVMTQREDRPDLLRVVVEDAEEPISIGERIPKSIVDGALYLHKTQNISVLLYDPVKGLGYFNRSSGWTVWFGSGDEMETKLLVYNQLVEEIRGVLQPGEIFMSDPDRPYYTVLWYEN